MSEFIIKLIITLIISWYLRSQIKPPAPPPPQRIEEESMPRCQEGIPIPVLWGRRQIKNPNVLFSEPVRVSARTETVNTK